ncbi:Ribokinase-like protein [Aureobasidium pullulans]|uniref:Ribokinase-like protein n=1 Tax=Aureobasidium pullulans TaxID=5580 RepID=A0A4S9ETH0_AURPU|nr:Ribokinase-like protein [Aureobasidium pullulans]
MYPIDFCTTGMFIIDDIYPSPSAPDQTPFLNIPGGAGTYSALGARVLSPSPQSKRVGWLVDAGHDFPSLLREIIDSWDTAILLRSRDGLTTKGWNGYGANEHRAFKYLTPKLRITAEDLSPELLTAKSFHLICAPARCIELVEGIKTRRAELGQSLEEPFFIWEPVPDLCVPAELDNTIKALEHVDIISPNHAELSDIFSVVGNTESGDVDGQVIEDCSSKLLSGLSASRASKVSVVVRSGKDGCYVASASKKAWLPAFHAPTPDKVVDPTGGGNGFLGGLAIGLVRTGDVVEASKWGNVAASFMIEQVGAPVLQTEGGKERWNGVVVEERMKEYSMRCETEGSR